MVTWIKCIASLGAVLIGCVAVHADLEEVYAEEVYAIDIEGRQSGSAGKEVQARPADNATPFDFPSVTDFGPEPIQLPPEAGNHILPVSRTQAQQVLGDGESSLSLLLSALIGVGMCGAGHSLKGLSFGFIPEWYHNGGPIQIGQSIAITADSVCPVPVRCFVQPVRTTENIMPEYRSGTIVSLWRESQFTPSVLTSRGPPLTC